MIKKICFVLSVLLLFTLLVSGITYAFYTYKNNVDSTKATTAKLQTELSFTSELGKGIPGETVIIVSSDAENTIKKVEGSADYIYKLTYETEYDKGDDTQYITDLKLSAAKVSDLGLIKAESYSTQSQRVVYFGKHTGDDLLLGELLATFSELKNPSMDKPFKINASVEACQPTESAVKDMFGIDSTCDGGKYYGLFE